MVHKCNDYLITHIRSMKCRNYILKKVREVQLNQILNKLNKKYTNEKCTINFTCINSG